MSSSRPDRTFLYIAAYSANLITFVCGTAFGWTSPVIPHLQKLASTPLHHVITASEEGWIGAFLPLAATVGPIAGGVLANKIGRKKTLLVVALPFLLAFFINVFATSMFLFYISRFFCGLGVGITFTVLPMYIGEISDDEVRGSLGSIVQLLSVLGMLWSYVLGPYLSIKVFNIILLFPPIMFLLLFSFFIPDSPYYLIQKGNFEGALEALTKLRGRDKTFVQKEIEAMKAQLEEDKKNKGSFKVIFKSRGLRTALYLSFSLVALQQFSGVNIVFYYSQNIFDDAGVSLPPEICTIIIGVIQIFASIGSLVIVQKSGKRFLLIFSGLGMALAQGMLAGYFYLKDNQKSDISNLNWIPIVSLIIYTITYCLGFGSLPWAIMGEIFPGNVRPLASSATASFCWTICFFITNYFGIVTEIIGKSGSFGFFCIGSLVAAIFVFKFVPETTGKSLHEIQFILGGSKGKIEENQNID